MSASSGGTDFGLSGAAFDLLEVRVGLLGDDVAQLFGGENLVLGGSFATYLRFCRPLLRIVRHASPVSSGTAVNPSVRKPSGSNVKTCSTSRSSASTLVA